MSLDASTTDRLPCGIVEIGADRRVRHCNRYALDLLACTDAALVAGHDVAGMVSIATHIILDSYVYPMLLEAGVAEEVQLNLKTRTGTSVPIVGNFRMNADRTVHWAFTSCVNRDQLYTELLDTRDALQDRTRSLGELNERIRERQSDLQTFCHSLSHDFTGPLQMIHRFVDLALEDLRGRGVEAPEEFRFLENARRNAKELVGLTRGLVEYLVADVAVPRDEAVDLEEVVSTVLAMSEASGSRALTVHRTSLPVVRGSRSRVQMVFKNLLENAVKYNENDPEITIEHAIDVAGARVAIAVKDNGIGMAEEQLETIFSPFTRLNTGDRYEGSGLGLSIVRKLVASLDGDIRVESVPGAGSTFHVSLPLDASRARAA